MRIEDTDQERSSIQSVSAILEALRWLGLDWHEGPDVGGPHGPYFQSERRQLYADAASRLIRQGKAFRCYCTKEQLDRYRSKLGGRDSKTQFVYPGTCRDRRDEPDAPFVVRFRSPEGGWTGFLDLVFGEIRTPNNAQQDFVIMRADGYPLYNLAAVVDDHEMCITLVARGREHIGNTAQQILLYRALGWDLPRFAHLPMMLSQKGEKLSKRHAAVAVQDYRDRGYTPMSVLNYLARFGWSHGDQEIFAREELVRLFSWDDVNRSDGKFDERKFGDVAFEHLKRPDLTPLEDYSTQVLPFLAARGLNEVDRSRLQAAIPLVRERARTLVDAAKLLDFFFREPPDMDEDARARFMKPDSASILQEVLILCRQTQDFGATALQAAFRVLVESKHLQMKDVAQPVRVALTGRTASPGLFEVMAVLGRETTVARLERCGRLVGELR